MPQRFTCERGHVWDLPDAETARPADSVVCPICSQLDVTPPPPMPGPAPALPESAAAKPAPPPGYELLDELGKGGMGIVYKARQQSLNRIVALKMVRAGSHAHADELLRFRAEATSVARLQHPNIVQIHEVGEHAGCPYFALEYVDGGSLARRESWQGVRVTAEPGQAAQPESAVGGSAMRRVAELIETLARAVHYAHQQGVVHRDLKPANILMTKEGAPKIADFGLAKQLDEDSGQTRTGMVMGTPSYMAPEQARGLTKQLGPAVDIYALGAILYELLTGRPPFLGLTPEATLELVRQQEPTPPRRVQLRVPRDLETICLKCLDRQPGKRYRTAEELADDVRRFLNHEPISARRAGYGERLVKWAKRRPAVASTLGIVALLLLGAGLAYLWYWDAYLRVKVAYFANVVNRRGVLEGVGPLTEEQVQRRYFSYKIYRRGGLVERLEAVNGQGELTTRHPIGAYIDDEEANGQDAKRECVFEYRRDEQGRLTDEVALDRFGRVVWILHYTNPETGFYTDAKGVPRPRATGGAVYVRIRWSEAGFETHRSYHDALDNPRPAAEGQYAEQIEADHLGLPTRVTYLDATGKPMWLKQGFAEVRRTYDNQGNLTLETYHDRQGNRVVSRAGMSGRRYRHDVHGNLTEEEYLGVDDKLIQPLQEHCALWRHSYDEAGNRVSIAAFDVLRKPVRCFDGYACVYRKHDERGNVTDWDYRDETDSPVRTRYGFARMKAGFDAENRRVWEAYFDERGRAAYADGFCRRKWQYDASGNEVGESLFDEHDRPVNRVSTAHHSTRWRYDELNRVVEESYHGAGNEPVIHEQLGYHAYRLSYDSRGNIARLDYLDAERRLMRTGDGVAGVLSRHDDLGRQIEETYFDENDVPCAHSDGYFRAVWEYDAQGNKTTQAYLGRNGAAIVHPSLGIHLVRWKYDERRSEAETSYFGVDGTTRVEEKRLGYHRAVWRRDAAGERIDAWYFDANGNPVEVRPRITAVEFGRLGERLALEVGDVLLSYDGKAIRNGPAFLAEWNASLFDGRMRELNIRRGGERLTIKAPPEPLEIELEDVVESEERFEPQEPAMPRKKKNDPNIMYVRKGATLREIYAQIRREFSAADLQKFTEDEPTVPMETVLAEMRKVHEAASRKKRRMK